MVNRWKKNNVALYSPTNVRMLIWADSTLFHTYEAVLPPAPPPRSASKDSLCSVGRPKTSPAPPVDTLLEQDRSSPWSGFEEVLPPNQEARPRSPTVPHTDPTLPLSPAIPPSQPTQLQPPSDPMMAMFQSLMSSFQSEIKTLRDDLSGSLSTMVAEAVAAHLPQVPYQFQTKIFLFMCLFIVHMLMLLICSPYKCYTLQCSPYNCYTLQTIPHLLVVYCTFLSPTFVRLLQSHLLQSCPWPHRSRDHPHRWCPLTSPNRDLPGYIAQWFWRPERMWTRLRSRRPPREGSHLPLHPPNHHPNDPDWTVPHLWQDLWIRLGYAFFRVITCPLSSSIFYSLFTIGYTNSYFSIRFSLWDMLIILAGRSALYRGLRRLGAVIR